ncbi:hypothetical protein PRUPE_6G339000 [Prunus persica]|uniref:Uncharacterized protein n=1 Tax=Prunus persica TaxID=3760 RepID=A0A251NZJ0_PRUPE|nr:hypothetical protein PRUPE_6G339000 [Prunus persica]
MACTPSKIHIPTMEALMGFLEREREREPFHFRSNFTEAKCGSGGERKAQKEEASRACFDDEVDDTRQQSHAAPEKTAACHSYVLADFLIICCCWWINLPADQ